MVVTREEFEEWKQLVVTKALFKQIAKDIEYMKQLLIYVGTEDLQALQGRCEASMKLLDLAYEDLYDDK